MVATRLCHSHRLVSGYRAVLHRSRSSLTGRGSADFLRRRPSSVADGGADEKFADPQTRHDAGSAGYRAVQTDIDKLNSEVAALQTQNGKLLAQNVQLQAQVTAQDAILQAQINTIQKSLQPTPRPPGSLLPGAISWYSLKNGGSSYDNLLIQVFQNPTQETEKPKL